jgi:hypothetical protein
MDFDFSSILLADDGVRPMLVVVVVAFSVTNEINVNVLHQMCVLSEAGVICSSAAWLVNVAAACGIATNSPFAVRHQRNLSLPAVQLVI